MLTKFRRLSPKEAESYYKRACDHQIGAGCSNLAYNAEIRPGSPDYKTALAQYEKACLLKDGLGCHNLANLYLNGNALPRDAPKAVSLLQKACELDFGQACYRVLA